MNLLVRAVCPRSRLVRFGGGKREPRCIVQHLAFLRREAILVSVGFNRALPGFGWHRAQRLHRVSNCLPAIRRQLLHLFVQLTSLLLLLGRQVLPGFHAVQRAVLLLRRHVIKPLQLVTQLLLPLRWKGTKPGIAFERSPLLFGREITVLAQPFSGMSLVLRPGLVLRTRLILGMRLVLRMGLPILRQRGIGENRQNDSDRYAPRD